MPKPAFQLARHAAWIAAAALLVPGPGFAQDAVPSAVTEAIAALLPNARPDQISPAPVPGLYEVRIGVQVVYVSRDGKYLVRGDVVDVAERRNLTELKRREARADLVKELSERSMIVFSPESAESPESAGSVKHTVTVFTDVDCAYCARLHRQITEYNDLGIEVRYLAFPRAGIGSASYDKTVSVWCSDDSHQAIGDAKFGRPVEPRTCDNPVKRHYLLGRTLGITGTPTIVLDNGRVVPGYVPPPQLAKMLEGG